MRLHKFRAQAFFSLSSVRCRNILSSEIGTFFPNLRRDRSHSVGTNVQETSAGRPDETVGPVEPVQMGTRPAHDLSTGMELLSEVASGE